AGGDRGQVRDAAAARRDDDGRRIPHPVVDVHAVAVAVRGDARDRDARAHRRGGEPRVRGEVIRHLAGRHEAVGVVARVGMSGQAGLPVGREQPQRLPAVGAPGVAGLASLEHDVVDAVLAEPTAHGEAGVSGPDDQDLGTHVELRAPYATGTVTLVGLVRASNTAERFCDCATSAAMSSSLASASMSKVTRTSLKPLRTSGSPPRMPRMSWSPSTIALTLFSWM